MEIDGFEGAFYGVTQVRLWRKRDGSTELLVVSDGEPERAKRFVIREEPEAIEDHELSAEQARELLRVPPDAD